ASPTPPVPVQPPSGGTFPAIARLSPLPRARTDRPWCFVTHFPPPFGDLRPRAGLVLSPWRPIPVIAIVCSIVPARWNCKACPRRHRRRGERSRGGGGRRDRGRDVPRSEPPGEPAAARLPA